MKRYIVKYNNGRVRQQEGINLTFVHHLEIGVIKVIVDTKEGKMMVLDDNEQSVWVNIHSYTSSDLIIND